MDIKILQSKINLLKAQVNQFKESGLFTQDEITRFSRPLLIELQQLEPQLAEAKNNQEPTDMDVVEPEIVS